jgi:outer membrane immunogenic protein
MGVIACQAASAADIVPRKAPPPAPPPAPIWNWTGFYVGGNFGVGIARDQWSGTKFIDQAIGEGVFGFTSGSSATANLGTDTPVGPLGGFTVGYNWQFPSTPWVVGLEGEFMFANLQGSHANSETTALASPFFSCGKFCAFQNTASVNASERVNSSIHDIATIAARFGITSGPEDRTLWYVKGGGAWVKNNFDLTSQANALACRNTITIIFSSTECERDSFGGSSSFNNNRWGWMVGTGVEWGLAYNLSAKIEYEFLDFGNHTLTTNVAGNTCFDGECFSTEVNRSFNLNQQIHVVKVGLNYRFNWGGY